MSSPIENCAICYKSIKFGGIGFAVNDEYAVHCECLEEYCVSTNCYECKLSKYPNCAFLDMKKTLMKVKGEK